MGGELVWNHSEYIIDQRTMELGSPRDMVRNLEEHLSFTEESFIARASTNDP